jgi:hypothetical protein
MKIVEVKKKVTHDFVLDIYDKAKRAKGRKRKELLEKAELLSKHIGDYLVEKVNLQDIP